MQRNNMWSQSSTWSHQIHFPSPGSCRLSTWSAMVMRFLATWQMKILTFAGTLAFQMSNSSHLGASVKCLHIRSQLRTPHMAPIPKTFGLFLPRPIAQRCRNASVAIPPSHMDRRSTIVYPKLCHKSIMICRDRKQTSIFAIERCVATPKIPPELSYIFVMDLESSGQI